MSKPERRLPKALLLAAAALLTPCEGGPFLAVADAKQPSKTNRRQNLGAEDLRKHLLEIEEIGLPLPATGWLMAASDSLQKSGFAYPGPVLLRGRLHDVRSLPLRVGLDTQLGKEPAEALQVLSRALRVHLEAAARAGDGTRPDPSKLRDLLADDKRHDWKKVEAIPALMQMLQAENPPIRHLLVEQLGQIKGKEAGRALALRAMTDLEPEVRDRATLELKKRPREEYVPLLLGGLRYPWKPIADHAAESISTLGLKDLVPEVVKMLDEPDSSVPFTIQRGGRTIPVVYQLVRINHMSNCVLCHAPSTDRADLVRGAAPIPGQAPPPPATTPSYYERGTNFVRADVTYLRQDFSVVQPVDSPFPGWPKQQRYDYVVRLRTLTPTQMQFLTRKAKERPTDQKEAMLFVLRELTGKDLGTTGKDWWPEVPARLRPSPPAVGAVATGTKGGADLPRPAGGLTQGGVERATAPEQRTEDLARSIPTLKGAEKEKAREDLGGRLARLSGTALGERLQDGLAEVRRAAARACSVANDKTHIPALIGLLDDPEDEVVQAARQSLQKLTNQDFGPKTDESKGARTRAAAAWASWWEKRLRGEGAEPDRPRREVPGEIVKLKKADPAERKKLLVALFRMGRGAHDAGPAVAEFLKDKDSSTRLDACQTLIQIEAPEVKVAIPLLVGALRAAKTDDLDDDDETRDRERARGLLVRIGDPALGALLRALEKDFPIGRLNTDAGVLDAAARQEALKVILGIGLTADNSEAIRVIEKIERSDTTPGERKLARQVFVKLRPKD